MSETVRRLETKIVTIGDAVGQTILVYLPTDGFIRNIRLFLGGTITVGGGACNGLTADGVANCFSSISAVLNGVKVWTIGGGAINTIATVLNGIAPPVVNPGLAAVAQSFRGCIDLGQAFRGLFNKRDFLLPTKFCSSAYLEIVLDNLNSILNKGAGTTLANTSMTLDGYCDITDVRVTKDSRKMTAPIFGMSYQTLQGSAVSALSDKIETISLSNSVLVGVLIRQFGTVGTISKTLLDTAITNVRITAGARDLVGSILWADQRAKVATEHGIVTPTGYAWFPLMMDGRITEGVETRDTGDVQVHLTITATVAGGYEVIPVYFNVTPVADAGTLV